MKVGNYRRIYKQDYSPGIQQDIDTLSVTLNDSFDTLFNALTNNLTFADNFNATVGSFTVTLDKNNAPITPISVKLSSYQTGVNGIIVINAVGSTNPNAVPNAGIFIQYSINNTTAATATNTTNPLTISIKSIQGLPQNTAFTISFIII